MAAGFFIFHEFLEDDSMNIGKLCKRRIVTIDRAGTLVQAAALMREHHVGALVVTMQTPEGAHVAGVVTDRDLVIDGLARGLAGGGVPVGELASERLVSVSEDDDLSSAIAAMREGGVRRLLVTDAELTLTGIVSLDDLMGACAGDLDGLAAVIGGGIEREVAETAAAPPAPLRVPAMGTAAWGRALA